MIEYSFIPGSCYSENGKTYRPFFINQVEVYRMDMAIMLGEDKKSADQQVVGLCDKIKEITEVVVSPGELQSLIASKRIIKE